MGTPGGGVSTVFADPPVGWGLFVQGTGFPVPRFFFRAVTSQLEIDPGIIEPQGSPWVKEVVSGLCFVFAGVVGLRGAGVSRQSR